ncbi:MAG: hypothetical protein P8176_06260, partial [Gammaproteobacteria bacterium]
MSASPMNTILFKQSSLKASCFKPSCFKPSCFKPDCFKPDCFNQGSVQTGSILILTLVFLLLTTLIGATTFFSSFTETRRAGNFSASALSFESTESALRAGETFLIKAKQ